MISRLLARLISGNLRVNPKPNGTHKSRSILTSLIHRLWIKLFFKDAEAPKFHIHRASLVLSLILGISLVSVASFSYWYHAGQLPSVLLDRAEIAAKAGDFRNEIEWRRRYLLVASEDIETQGRLALAVDSLVRTENLDDGSRGTFEAMRQLEVAENLSDELDDELNDQLRKRLAKRYLEASEILANAAVRQEDEPMEDSLLGEAIGYLTKAMTKLDEGEPHDNSNQTELALQKLAIRRAILQESIHSPATFEMRSDTNQVEGNRRNLEGQSDLFSKKQSLWFDDALRHVVTANQQDESFLNFLLSYRDNENFPWNEAKQDGWQSQVWKELPQLILDRVQSLDSNQGQLITLRLDSLLGERSADQLANLWSVAADQLCATTDSRVGKTNSPQDGDNQPDSVAEKPPSRDEFQILEAQAAFFIIFNAWQQYPVDRLDEKSAWWLEMCRIAEEDQSELLANLFVTRARRHIANDNIGKGVVYLQQAIDIDDVTPLEAYETLAEINLENAINGEGNAESQTESANKTFESSLDQYLAAIRKQTRELEQLDLPETDRFGRVRRRLLLAHRSTHEVMSLTYRWRLHRKTPSLNRFNELMKEGGRLGFPAAFDQAQSERVAEIFSLASDSYGAATLFEDAQARHPKDPALRNRCFDIWFGIGNFERAAMYLSTATSLTDVHGQARLLFMRLLQILKDPENSEAIATLREQAEILQLTLLEEDDTRLDETANRVTQRALKYVQIMIPDDDTPIQEYVGSPLMRERLFEFAKTEPTSSWISGLVFGLLQFETPENRSRWLETLPQFTTNDNFSTVMSQARAYEAMNRYYPAIRRLLDADDLTKPQVGLAKTYAADLAEIAAGTAVKREILLSIPEADRTPQQWFQLCLAELKLVVSARQLLLPAYSKSTREQLDQHRASLLDLDGEDGKFALLLNAWYKFALEAKEYRSSIKKNEELTQLAAGLDRLLEQKPWWTPLLTLRGMVAAEMKDTNTAIERLSLAIKSGDASVATKRELISQLDSSGEKQQVMQLRRELQESVSRYKTIWASYRQENPRLRNRNTRLSHLQNLAMSHDVSQAWLMWAGSLADACRQSISRDLYQQFIRQAEYCLTRVERLGFDDALSTLRVRHQIAIVRNNLSEALKVEEAIQELANSDSNASDALIACVLTRGETKQAIEMLKALNENEPTEARLIKQAQCQSGIGLSDQAEISLKRAKELFPESEVVRETLARWISVKKDPQEAKNQLQELLLGESTSPASERDQLTYVQLINGLGKSNATDQESIDLLLKLAATNGVYAELAGHAALTMTSRSIIRDRADDTDTVNWLVERLDDCVTTLEEREWITANDLSAYGNALASLHPRPAQAKMDQLLDRVADQGESRLRLTLELQWWKDHKTIPELAEFVNRWREGVIQDQSVPESIANCLACADHVNIGNLETALSIFSEAFSENPRILETYLRLLTESGQTDQLVTFTEKAIELSSNDEEYELIAVNGIRFLIKVTDDSALKVAEQLIANCPNSLPILDFASQLHFIRGQHAKAAVFLSRINEIQPDKVLVLNNLAMCLIEIPDQLGRAVEIAEKANRLAPHDASIMDTLAVALLRDGQPDRAVAQLESAIAIRKEPRFLFHLLLAYEQLGKQDEYEQAFNLLSQIDLDDSGLTSSEKEIYKKKFL